jgi:uncharacterized surface protein with fasciclin (FAS1) repeats
VWDVIISNEAEFATFIAAAEAVGYDAILQSSDAVTVFVPNEMAFLNLLPLDLLAKYFDTDLWTTEYILELLSCHDIDGAVILSSNLRSGAEFATCMDILDPEFVFTTPPPQISKSTMPVPANLVQVDVETMNGVVHVVDQVMTTSFLRFNLPEAAEELGQFSILLELVVLTDLFDFVEGEGPFTLYAPTDEVFEKYGDDFVNGLKDDIGGTRDILLNHVVPDQIVSCCLEGPIEFTSAAGFPLILDNFSDETDAYTINDIPTVAGLTNVLVSNAKINVVTDLIVPPTPAQ